MTVNSTYNDMITLQNMNLGSFSDFLHIVLSKKLHKDAIYLEARISISFLFQNLTLTCSVIVLSRRE